MGEIVDVQRILPGCDVYVQPSRSEAFGVALLEAMTIGLPCIASDTGGPRDLLAEDAGILCPPDDVDALAEGMLRMLEDAVRKHYAMRAYERAELFTSEHAAQRYAALYENMLRFP